MSSSIISITKLAVAVLAVTLAMCVPVARGQVMLSPALSESNSNESKSVAGGGESVDRATPALPTTIKIRAQAAPDSLLRYRLWPAPEDRRHRPTMNAVNRSLLLVSQVSAKQKREFLEGYDIWSQLPVDEIPLQKAKAACVPFGTAINVLRTGEGWMDLSYDLGLDEMSVEEMIGTLLPEYQEMRDLARLLSMRARIAIAEQRWEDAVDDLRLGFRLSEIAGHGTDTLLSRMIGIAISETMFDTITTMIQQPNSPNLYWALAGLPVDHLFEINESLEYESTLWHHVGSVAGLDPLPGDVIGESRAVVRLQKIIAAYSTGFWSEGASQGETMLRELWIGVEFAAMLGPARRLLAESPDWKDRLDELSDAEVLLRASDFELSRIRDRWLAWSMLPFEYWDDYGKQRQAGTRIPREPITLGGKFARQLIPASLFAMDAGRRATQYHHFLMTLEAIRMHAAQTDALPASLDTSLPVPAWIDPVTRKPFSYLRHSPVASTIVREKGMRGQDNLEFKIQLQVGP